MFVDPEFKNNLNSDDIIVWNGTVTRWHYVKHLVLDGDMVRIANDEEVDNYHKKHPKKNEENNIS